MKILIFGGSGMLGHKLVQKWTNKFDVWTTVREDLRNYENANLFNKQNTIQDINVENILSVEKVINDIKPNVIVNAVGVVKQLPTAKNVVKTLSINSIFPHHLADLSQKYKTRLITISTDCVFNGEKGNYNEMDIPDAFDLYGKSKNLGEVTTENCLTVRTSIIGREINTAHSLVEWFLSNRGGKVKGFVNAIYTGFPTTVFADILAELIEKHQNLNGLYHISSEPINKYNLLKLINAAYNARIEIEADEDFKIDRSLDSTKFRKATGFNPTSWQEMIELMANDNRLYERQDEIINKNEK
jgi:dTDP-4-dehydrorhamnose reductase